MRTKNLIKFVVESSMDFFVMTDFLLKLHSMKKIFLILFSGWISNVHAQTSVYHPFPESNAAWNNYYAGSWHICDEEFSFLLSGDTVIANLTYHKIEVPYVLRHG